jgi:hypothetical protein
MQCHLEELQTGRPYLAKHNISESDEVFTRFYFKLGTDFKLSQDNGGVQLLELRDSSGDYFAMISVGYKNDIGFHVYASCRDNTGYNASLPGSRGDYPLSYIPVIKSEWVRIDLRTKAHEGKGGAEFWVNGIRSGCITNRCTTGKAAKSLYIGMLNISNDIYSGDIFIDDITVSDSYLR